MYVGIHNGGLMFNLQITYMDDTEETWLTEHWTIHEGIPVLRFQLDKDKWRYVPLSNIKYFHSTKKY